MNDNNNNKDPELSDSLRRIVPADLSPEGLVDGARHKRRKRTGVIGAAAALLVVGLAVPVALNLPNNDITAQPATSPSSPVEQMTEVPGTTVGPLPGAAACYNDDGTPISWNQEEAAPAEPGAVRAWFCGDYSPETGQGFIGPLEPLTSGLDQIIADVQAAEVVDLARTTCMSDYNLSFNAVFEYEDGTRRIIGGDRHGCRTTYDGGVARAGGDEFYGALYNAWQEQRKTDTGDWVVPHFCPGPLSLLEMAPGAAVQGSLCGDQSGMWTSTYLSDDLLKEAAESMQTMLESPAEGTPQPNSTAPEQRVWLTLSNKFTDYLTLVRHEDGIYRAYDGEGLEWFWQPSQELGARLDEAWAAAEQAGGPALGSTNPGTTHDANVDPVDPGESPDVPPGWVSEGCQDVASGALVSTDLPEGALPVGAERIWLCRGDALSGTPAPPMEPLVDATLISDAVSSFNDMPVMAADRACTMELGPSYVVVHEYADQTRYAVQMQDYGCRPVVAGDAAKEGGEQYLATLADLWARQRVEKGTTQTRPGPLCQLYSSVFPVPADTTFTSATACIAIDDATGVAGVEEPIPANLLPQMVAQMAKAPLAVVDAGTDGRSIVLLSSAGDPFMISHLEDGTYYWSDGDDARVWTPTGDVAAALTPLFEE
ncbi:MAG: hypothetical protein Q4P15_10185 [Propionibacteriaceae bacterium]|nr:hypothetical protein [Propionibacteriaceae bacterium]